MLYVSVKSFCAVMVIYPRTHLKCGVVKVKDLKLPDTRKLSEQPPVVSWLLGVEHDAGVVKLAEVPSSQEPASTIQAQLQPP
jgi:hypothetical protein